MENSPEKKPIKVHFSDTKFYANKKLLRNEDRIKIYESDDFFKEERKSTIEESA